MKYEINTLAGFSPDTAKADFSEKTNLCGSKVKRSVSQLKVIDRV
ncbi:hypothetical protein [Polaromonas sp.]|nr:hypothetical protein [Polaromonas sp.]